MWILLFTTHQKRHGRRDEWIRHGNCQLHYSDVIMGTRAPQITSLTIVYTTVYSGANQGKHQSSASLAFVREIHRWLVNSPHKWPVTREMFPFGDVIMVSLEENLSSFQLIPWISMPSLSNDSNITCLLKMTLSISYTSNETSKYTYVIFLPVNSASRW